MRIAFEGREYEWDSNVLSVEEGFIIQDNTGLGLGEFNAAVSRNMARAVTTLVFLAKKRSGEAVRWQDMLGMNLGSYSILPEESPSEDSQPEDVRPDPTSPSGETPELDTTTTS